MSATVSVEGKLEGRVTRGPELQEQGDWRSLTGGAAAIIISIVACLAACLTIALQAPGQISMDTSIQLYEAFTGQSISYHPPFMSALLHWLGGGLVATSLMVLINTLLLYGSFALIAISVAQLRNQQGLARVATWRVVLAVLVVMNPIVFLYTGIVWKDVLFASLMTAGSALAIAASVGGFYRRHLCAVVALILLAAAMITRQQGVFMVPFMVVGVIVALWSCYQKRRVYLVMGVFLLFVALTSALERQVDCAIKPPANVATSVGFRNIMIFDLAGIVSNSKHEEDAYAFSISREQLEAIRAVYSPERVDTLDRTTFVQDWVGSLSISELKSAWWAMVKQNPQAYMTHRLLAYGKLMGLRGLEGTLPIHIGVEGNASYLNQVGIETGRSQRTQLIYDIARYYFSWPIYHHVFWLLALVAVIVIGFKVRPAKVLLLIGALIAGATALMYASFLPTTIAADFRYLFGAIPLVMLLSLVLLLGGSKPLR